MQFHGIGLQTVTLSQEMFEKKHIGGPTAWLIACSQLVEAISYIHKDAQILHNDIKADNISSHHQTQVHPTASTKSF